MICLSSPAVLTSKYLQWVVSNNSIPQYQYLYISNTLLHCTQHSIKERLHSTYTIYNIRDCMLWQKIIFRWRCWKVCIRKGIVKYSVNVVLMEICHTYFVSTCSYFTLGDNQIHYVLYCTVLYCTVLYCTVLYCTVLYCTVLYCTVLYCTVLIIIGLIFTHLLYIDRLDVEKIYLLARFPNIQKRHKISSWTPFSGC
jgi:hypothetical protein